MEKQLKTNQSIEKSFLIIEIMANEQKSMKLQDISRRAHIPQATALRILYTLMRLGYVTQDDSSSQYSLTLKFSYIGSMVEKQLDLRALIRPFLIEIGRECGEAACLSILSSKELLYIDTVDSQDNILASVQRIGKRAPLYCTGAGKIYLADMSEQELSEYLLHQPLTQLTIHTITTQETLRKELAQIRQNGYAYDNEECELGLKCLALPVHNYSGKVIATISISGPISRFTAERLRLFLDKMSSCVKIIEHTLSYSGSEEETPF